MLRYFAVLETQVINIQYLSKGKKWFPFAYKTVIYMEEVDEKKNTKERSLEKNSERYVTLMIFV